MLGLAELGPTYDQLPAIGMRIAKLGNSSARYELALFRNDEEEASAAGYIVYIYVDRASNQSTAIPEHVRAALLKLVD